MSTISARKINRNSTFIFGVIINLMLYLGSYFAVPWPASLVVIAGVFYYFGYLGLVNIPVAHKAIPLFLGTRMRIELSEGLNWVLPYPIMEIRTVDTREKTLNVPHTETLSLDQVPITIDVSAQVLIYDPYVYLSINDPETGLVELIERTVRWYTHSKLSTEIASCKIGLSEQIGNEISRESEEWGIRVRRVFVTDVRLPANLEATYIRRQQEKVEKESDMTEMQNLAARIRVLVAEGFTPMDALTAAQVERGNVDKKIIEGSAGDLLKLAGVLSGKN